MELFNIGPLELLFLLALAILVVGPQRAVELAGQLGRLLAGVRRNVNLVRSELRQRLEEEAQPLREVEAALREPDQAGEQAPQPEPSPTQDPPERGP